MAALSYGSWNVHGPTVGWVGMPVGGVIQGGLAKSKNSVMSGWALSRAVRFGRLKRVSMNLSIAV